MLRSVEVGSTGTEAMDVGAWLSGLGLGEHFEAFSENGVDADLLPDLTNEDLKDLGVVRLVDRKRLLKAIAELHAMEPRPSATLRPEAAGEGERRQVTVLFADIAGFTPLAERLGAEATHALLNRYFEAADRIVEEFGGTVDKHIGDNVMAVFGAPVAHDNDPERAVRAALAIHEAARGIALPEDGALGLHIGIASGQVVASGTGSDAHREYTVTGDSVNLAARLQGLAGRGQTLVSESVHRRTAGQFSAAALGPQTLKGIAQPVAVWRVDAAAAVAKGRSTHFVGRRAELGQCRAILAEVAATGEGQTILLRGPAGIGKTRLAEEIVRAAREVGFDVHRSLVLDFGSQKGQGAIPALVRSLIGLPPSSTKEERVDAADAAFAAGAFAEAERVFLNDLLDLPQPVQLHAVYDAMDDATRRAGRSRLVAGLVAWAGRSAPQLVLVEDLHWADALTLERLAAVIGAVRENPVALLATTRPEGDPLEGAWRAISQDQPVSIVNLSPLRDSEARAMAAGFAQANDDRLAECLERAGGNPLFLEQLLQNVAESAEALVPGSIQSLVLARMDRLDPADKRALQAASVFGQRFSLAALRHLTGTPAYDPAELLRHQLVRPEGEDFLFAHALVRDGVYESILSAPRARLHLKAADLFAATDPVLHARHLEMASSPETSRAYIRASESESAHHRPAIALELAERATTAAATPEDELSAAILRARLLVDLGRFADAILHWDTAIELATDLSMRGRALLGKAEALRLGNRSEDALVILDEAEQLLERTEQGNSLAWLSHLRGNLFFTLGQSEECLSHHQKALDLARANGFADVEVAALGGLGDAMYALGSIESSLKYFDDCVQKASNIGAKRSEAANLPMAAVTRFFSLDLEPALRDVERAIDLSHRIGHLRAEFIARSVIDFLLFERCERAELERNHLICRKLVEKLDAKVFRAFVHEQAAKSLELAQDPEAARKELSAALEILGERSMIFAGPRVLAHAAMTSECANEAVALIDRALLELSNGALAHNHLTAYRDAIDVALRWGLWDRAEDHIDAFEQFRSQEALDWREYFVKRGRALLELGKGRNYDAVCETLDPMLDAAMRKSWAFEIVALGGALEAARRGSPWRLPSRSMLASAGCQLES